MTLRRLILREIAHRKLNFALGVCSVLVAVGILVAELTLLRSHDLQTDRVLAKKHDDAERELAKLEDDYRKYMKELGYNLLILPAKQELIEFQEKGYATHTMPEQYVTALADSGVTLMRHLLPVVQRKVYWPEKQRTIYLIGTRGEVEIKGRKPKEPMLKDVPSEKAVVGYRLAEDLHIAPGQAITFMGRKFQVHDRVAERGTVDDVTIWIPLATAQELLDMKGRINAIEALKCFCLTVRGKDITAAVRKILKDDVKVMLRENQVTVREKTRQRAAEHHDRAIAEEKAHRASLKQKQEQVAAILCPLIVLGCAVWVGLLAFGNVRDRRPEIGVLRAIGLRSRQVFQIFFGKAVAIGVAGALAGAAAGFAIGIGWDRLATGEAHTADLLSAGLFAAVLLAAPLLSAAASWLPALLAAQQDPAVVLSQE